MGKHMSFIWSQCLTPSSRHPLIWFNHSITVSLVVHPGKHSWSISTTSFSDSIVQPLRHQNLLLLADGLIFLNLIDRPQLPIRKPAQQTHPQDLSGTRISSLCITTNVFSYPIIQNFLSDWSNPSSTSLRSTVIFFTFHSISTLFSRRTQLVSQPTFHPLLQPMSYNQSSLVFLDSARWKIPSFKFTVYRLDSFQQEPSQHR